MKISVKGKQLDVGDAWRRNVEERLPVIAEKYFGDAQEAQVTLSKDKARFLVDVAMRIGRRMVVQSHGVGVDAQVALDDAAEHLDKRLRRYKRRLRDHNRTRLDETETLPARQYVLAAEADEPESEAPDNPIVIAEMDTEIETLSVGEAVMHMDLANLPSMLFRNRAHGGINMVYRRQDGHVGWVDPRGNRRGEEGGA